MHFKIAYRLFVVIASLASGSELSQAQETTGREPSADMTTFLLAGNAAHQESFASLQTKFRITRGLAKSFEDAVANNLLTDPPPVVCNVSWTTQGENFRRDQRYTDDVISAHTQREGQFLVQRYVNRTTIWNSSVEIEWMLGQSFHVGPRGDLDVDDWNPLNVGWGDTLHKMAENRRRVGTGDARYLEDRVFNGRSLPVLEFSLQVNIIQHDYMWVDPDHGFFPIRGETWFNNEKEAASVRVIREFSEFSGGRWLPKVALHVDLRSSPVRVTRFDLDEADVDRPPADDAFTISVPAGLGGSHRFTKRWMKTPSGRVSLAAFRADGSLMPNADIVWDESVTQQKIGTVPALMDLEKSTVREWPFGNTPTGRSLRWALAFVVVVAAIACGIWILMRQRRGV